MKNTVFAAILCALLCGVSTGAEIRTWTSGKYTVEAELVGVSTDGKSITLRRSDNGKEITLLLDKLSEKDRRYVEKQKTSLDAAKSGSFGAASKGISVQSAFGKRRCRALLIGVNKYDALKPLNYCEADATALRDALLKLGFESGDITLLTSGGDKRPTRLNIEEHLEALFDGLAADDMVLISLSGHGGQFEHRSGDSSKRNSYFCPEDARTHQPERTMVPIREIYEMLDRCPARFKLLLVDACRDEHFVPDGAKTAIDESRSMNDFSKSMIAGKLPKGTVMLLSCVGGQQSYESPRLRQGIFMYHVVQGALGQADENGDGVVSVIELRDYVMQQTKDYAYRELKKSQTPRFHAELEMHDFGLFDLSKLDTKPEVDHSVEAAMPAGPVTQYPGLDDTPGKLLRVFGETNPLNACDNYPVNCVAYSSDGSMIASGGSDKTAKVWNVVTGEQILSISHTESISSVCFSPSSKLLLSTSMDGLIKVSNIATGRMISQSTWDGKFGRAYTLSSDFSPDERYVAIGTGTWRGGFRPSPQANAAHLFAVGYTKPARSCVGHKEAVNSVAFSPDGKWLLTGSADKILGIWDVQTGKSLKTLHGHTGAIDQVAFSPDGKSALSLSVRDNTLRVWDIENGNEIRSFADAKRYLVRATFSPSGKTLVACVTDNNGYILGSASRLMWLGECHATIILWDISTGKVRGSFDCQLKNLKEMTISPDGRTVVIGGEGDGDATSPPKLQLLSTGLKE